MFLLWFLPMASLWKHPKSKFFVGCFSLPDGRRTKRSTKTTDRKLAQKLVNEWEEAARRSLTETQARRVVGDIYELIHGDTLEKATVDEYLQRWLSTKKVETSPITFQKYEHIARQFLDFLDKKASLDIASIGVKEITGFRDRLAGKVSSSTANLAVKIIGSLFAKAHRDGLVDSNPVSRVQGVSKKGSAVQRRAFTIPELKRILEECDPEWEGMVLCGLYSGQRLKDIATLTWQNIDLQQEEFRLVSGKTGRRVLIPLAEPLRRYLEKLPSTDDPQAPLFPKAFASVQRAKSGTAATLSGQFYRLMVAAALVKSKSHHDLVGKGRSGKRNTSEIGFHALRHTATSMMKNAGINSATVQDLIGHESAAVSAHYTHIDDPAKRRAINSMPDITR